ncbi:hypothetical protein NQ318_007536 [Aromia moschata]|uniref:Phospholipase A2-like domain-containing protein n=1 Tax=Aromia moschata TaxID=1265417 RepID=A0AAV8YCT8_9CUCU|nr:hypothetical protein NQ318_007536 [Aromia moschata]
MLMWKQGAGGIHSIISKIPWELHLPKYSYCGPNTRLAERLAKGDQGINELDRSCRDHDIAYSKSSNLQDQHKADYVLEQRAWKRVKSKDASLGEKTNAWLVTNVMKLKRKLGMGVRSHRRRRRRSRRSRHQRKKVGFHSTIVKNVKKLLSNNNNLRKNANIAVKAARSMIKQAGGKKNIRMPRVLPLPKTGGILPLLPIFAGPSALGTLAGGSAAVAKTVLDAKANGKRLEEAQKHNRKMEAIALGKQGSGLYLKPYKKGYGLYLKKNFH